MLQRGELERMARSSYVAASDGGAGARRCCWRRMVSRTMQIARECDTTADTVRRWRAKFEAGGVDAVGSIAPGRGRKPEIDQDTIDAIVVGHVAHGAR